MTPRAPVVLHEPLIKTAVLVKPITLSVSEVRGFAWLPYKGIGQTMWV